MNQHSFPEEWRRGVYEAIARRRDMRSFRPDPLPREVLARLLWAAHHAGSVGFSQPWRFLLVEDPALRRRIQAHVDAERLRAAEAFDDERRAQYLGFKLEGILDAPINLCVACDTSCEQPTIGRHTIRETDVYSTCCAVQNLWLAARSEGVGVGWVSILQPEALRELLGLPAQFLPVAYLCLGYVDEFPERPLLEAVGWLPRRSLADVVYAEEWGRPPDAELAHLLDQEQTRND